MFNKILPQKMVTSRYIVWWKLNLCFLYSHWKTVLKFYDVIKVLQRGPQRFNKGCDCQKTFPHFNWKHKRYKTSCGFGILRPAKKSRELEIVHSGCWWLTRNTILSNNITFNGPRMALSKFSLHLYLIFLVSKLHPVGIRQYFDWFLSNRKSFPSIHSSCSALYNSIFR